MSDEMKTVVANESDVVDRAVEPRTYEPTGGNITKAMDKPFTVKSGYKYFKVWVKALSNSSNITCTVTKGTATGEIIEQFPVYPGTNDARIKECTSGTYVVKFASSGNMNGQYNVKVATSRNELV